MAGNAKKTEYGGPKRGRGATGAARSTPSERATRFGVRMQSELFDWILQI